MRHFVNKVTIINIYAPDHRTPKQTLIKLKKKNKQEHDNSSRLQNG